MIEVKNTISIYEVNDKEVTMETPAPLFNITNHWNRDNMVVIELGHQRITVVAKDLEAAIHNATNVSRY